MTNLFGQLSPFLTKTTAIMSAVIILVVISALLVSVEREINRGTVQIVIYMIWSTIFLLIGLEGFLSYLEYTR